MVAVMNPEPSLAGRDGLVCIIEQLRCEIEAGKDWENDTLPRFLESFGALLGSIENTYANTGQVLPDDPWAIVGDALKGARNYE